jgi:hypothetical protein
LKSILRNSSHSSSRQSPQRNSGEEKQKTKGKRGRDRRRVDECGGGGGVVVVECDVGSGRRCHRAASKCIDAIGFADSAAQRTQRPFCAPIQNRIYLYFFLLLLLFFFSFQLRSVAEQQTTANALLASDGVLRAWHARLQVRFHFEAIAAIQFHCFVHSTPMPRFFSRGSTPPTNPTSTRFRCTQPLVGI